jgi:hypothetical protein
MDVDQLYEMAQEQAGEWGPERLAAWMTAHGLSLNGAADALGLSRRMIAHYRTAPGQSLAWWRLPAKH